LSHLFNDLQPQYLARFSEWLLHVAVDSHPVPTEFAALVEKLTNVAADFGDQRGPTSLFTLRRANGLGSMDAGLKEGTQYLSGTYSCSEFETGR
jgi:hypothetical protein